MNELQFQINEAIARASGEYEFTSRDDQMLREGLKPKAYRTQRTQKTAHAPQKPQRTQKHSRKHIDLSTFTLCTGDEDKCEFSVTFSGGYMRFSNTCMDELQEPDYIQIFLDRSGKRLAIKAAPADAEEGSKIDFLHGWRVRAEKARAAGNPVPQKEAKIGKHVGQFRRIFGIERTHKFKGEWLEEEGAIIFDMGHPVR